VPWPTINPNDSMYQQDLRHFLRLHGMWLQARHAGMPMHH